MNILSLFEPIRAFVLDVDGVLTDGLLLLLDDGQQARTMNIRDGYALQLAVKKGYHILVISGGESAAVRLRLEKLGVKHVYMGVSDKVSILEQFIQEKGLAKEEILYMGDDMPDWKVMQCVSLPVCPADAAPEIRQISRYISHYPGGKGCVRDVIEKVMKLQQRWEDDGHTSAK